jgi:hypothetical protein
LASIFKEIAKVGSNQTFNKIAFAKATQVIVNSVPTHTHNQMVKVPPHSPRVFLDLLYVLKYTISPPNHETKPHIMVIKKNSL